MYYEILKCHEDLRAKVQVDPKCVKSTSNECTMKDVMILDEDGKSVPKDPKCEELVDINKWLEHKSV